MLLERQMFIDSIPRNLEDLTVGMVSPFRIADGALQVDVLVRLLLICMMFDFFALASMLFWSHHSETMSIDDCMFCGD